MELERNICRFIPSSRLFDGISISEFIYEKKPKCSNEYRTVPLFRAFYITKGELDVKTVYVEDTLKQGDIFFLFPAMKFAFPQGRNAEYIYISFYGTASAAIADKVGITPQNCIFKSFDSCHDQLMHCIGISTEQSSGFLAESCLYRLFGEIVSLQNKRESEVKDRSMVLKIKDYIEKNYSNPSLRVSDISATLSYNQNYLSTVFKRETGFTVGQYLLSVRIQNACSLAASGISSISDIAAMTGFSDPLYFSRVFRQYMQVSPKQFVKNDLTENKK